MARGLSQLQLCMLRLAQINRAAEGRGPVAYKCADVFFSEVLAAHFGWKPRNRRRQRLTIRTAPGAAWFSPGRIGNARYNAAMASVSRAARRLVNRGLADAMKGTYSRWAGLNLTEAGVAASLRFFGEASQAAEESHAQ